MDFKLELNYKGIEELFSNVAPFLNISIV